MKHEFWANFYSIKPLNSILLIKLRATCQEDEIGLKYFLCEWKTIVQEDVLWKHVQTTQPQRPKNLEIKVKKPGALGKNLLMYWWHQEELKAVDENKVSIYLCFLPFWQSGQNVSWCNKLVTITLFGIFALNMVVRLVSCQPVNQIFLRTAHLYSIGAKQSILQDK